MRLVTNNLYAESAEFTIQAGEHSTFEVGNVVRGLGAVPFMLFGFGPYRVFLSDPEITRE
ncbi:MAG: hypothetical protein HY248_05355 [Fimbriimonas ginsengisoli]|nr:hypothetical protein [Fimbriimonas ginsengisoli]